MKKIKVGIFGVGTRGYDLGKQFMMLGCEIVALCEPREDAIKKAVDFFGSDVAHYYSFDEFINHPMDVVLLTNNFQEHAPYAIKCMKKGIHVFSECISNGTMAEGVELIEAYENSNAIYMLAENYPFMIFNREIKKVCSNGSLGKILYAEGEYNHPVSPSDSAFAKLYNYYPGHWRNYTPTTYYITHSLGPIMYATGATPRKVTAFNVFLPFDDNQPTAKNVGDRVSLIMTQNDDGSVFRVTGCAAFGAHHKSYRVCGTKGQVENLRGMGTNVMVRYNKWDAPEGFDENNMYEPKWNDPDEELIRKSGHGGADYVTGRYFLDCVRAGKQPEHPFNVYSAVAMSSVAILAHRSVLNGNMPYDIPDFRDKNAREQYRNDRQTPFFGADGSEPNIPCSSVPEYKVSENQLKLYKEALNSK